MSVINWRDSFDTGVEQFDQEHHKIIELIDATYVAVRDKLGKEIIEKLCQEVVTYTEVHFVNEEQTLASINYPDLEEQKVAHLWMREEIKKIQVIIAANATEGATALYHFLREWLINHIMVCDKKYGSYLQDVKKT